ncbi:hypothetical protein [Aeromicrobium endophyticum]|uniref:DUF4832 domain-containing protein n=1 Tax=Aeromicrobium endophyticum TaxID=2292704 RepID=A0A371P1P8_9ACTN|nr:hypothetical protein [Aeromicrobium endophyticum]REK69869.1 hypothetical protein DX116_11805 [Aeromicrobium endophyticum]
MSSEPRRRGSAARAAALAAVLVLLAMVVAGAPTRDEPGRAMVLPYSAPDVVNPMRGQFENILTSLFPQSNEAQAALPDWPGTRDAAIRVTWRSLQPVDPASLPSDAADDARFDFSSIDRALDEYDARGMRLSLRITTYDSCCDPSPPGGVNLAVPDWLAARGDAVERYDRDGVQQVIPAWNSTTYLDAFEALLGALGRRYDGDERLAIFEMSGYGDFGENVLPVLRDDLGRPGPSSEQSEAELGYLSQYQDQFITAASADRLVAANLRAFPRTQMVAAPGNAYIVAQLMRDSPALDGLAHPVGIRSDCLGVFDTLPTWAIDESSEYVRRSDPIIEVLKDRLRTAPVLAEWCQLPDGETPVDYYRKALRSVVERHVSMTSSSGFPDQLSDRRMRSDEYALWRRANVYAGYRYDARAQVDADASGVIADVRWTNRGVSSTHERWTIGYQLRDAAGRVVATADSRLDLRDVDTDQDGDAPRPTPASADESVRFELPEASGRYTVTAVVAWAEHKAAATTTVDMGPMNLAMPGRDGGPYEIGSVTIR